MTHWTLSRGRAVEIVNFIDDHSRLCLRSVALPVATAIDVGRIFQEARARYGTPGAVLSDTGAIYTAGPRGGKVVLEQRLVGVLRPVHVEPPSDDRLRAQ